MSDEVDAGRRVVQQVDDGPLVPSLVEAVASIYGVDPTTLPPLQLTINTDALESLLDTSGKDGTVVTVEFDYATCRIAADSDGFLSVTGPTEDR